MSVKATDALLGIVLAVALLPIAYSYYVIPCPPPVWLLYLVVAQIDMETFHDPTPLLAIGLSSIYLCWSFGVQSMGAPAVSAWSRLLHFTTAGLNTLWYLAYGGWSIGALLLSVLPIWLLAVRAHRMRNQTTMRRLLLHGALVCAWISAAAFPGYDAFWDSFG